MPMVKRGKKRFHPVRVAKVIHEDEHLVVADKPAGLLTVGTDRERHRTLYRQMFARARKQSPGGRIFIVHRLDRDASGLVVFAKSEPIKRALQGQFRSHSAGRTYNAVVYGRFEGDEREFRSHLAENRALEVYVTPDTSKGKLSVSRVRVLRRSPKATLLEVRLDTGRKHQIRVHLAHAGHPIMGDRRYGDDKSGPLGRLGLHATTLEFTHPATGERMRLDAPLPKAFLGPFARPRRKRPKVRKPAS
jgi:23S rRNA pseudouridine1911/1915/1917 synthase